MTPDQADTLHMLAVVAVLVGTVELVLGILFRRTDDKRRFTGYLLQHSGVGFVAAGLIFYFAPNYYLGLGAGIAIAAIGCNSGALHMLRAMKASSRDLSR